MIYIRLDDQYNLREGNLWEALINALKLLVNQQPIHGDKHFPVKYWNMCNFSSKIIIIFIIIIIIIIISMGTVGVGGNQDGVRGVAPEA